MVTEQIFLTQDIDFETLGFLYGVCGRTARDWFNKASVLLISIFFISQALSGA